MVKQEVAKVVTFNVKNLETLPIHHPWVKHKLCEPPVAYM